MISLPFPIVLVLAGALFWRVTLAISIELAGIGFVLPWRWARVACFMLAGLLATDSLLALWLPAD